MTTCPRCAQADVDGPSCPRCGVVFAKLAAHESADRRARRPAPPPRRGSGSPWPWLALGLAAVVAAAAAVVRPAGSARPLPPAAPVAAVVPVRLDVADLPPPTLAAADVPAPRPIDLTATALNDADAERARALSIRLGAAGAAEVQQAEELYARQPEDAQLRSLLEAVLMSAARNARSERRREQALAWLQKAASIGHDARPWLALTELLAEGGDWTGVEAAARGALALDPRSAHAWSALGYALLRQDRSREAVEALEASLALRDDAATRALLARVTKGLRDESGMTQQTLSHFNVRYDGGEHEGVGREILRALERHYATLAATLDHQPAGAIPVILFSRDAYYDASGAPTWSGGAYDTLDGRIRIPIGGLTPSLTPDIDTTLIHELTHAFVADRTRGAAPRDLHEGLAQYMEGKRSESMLGREGMRALADGHVPGVYGFYLGSLSFVEYLISSRGMGGMNDLLRGIGETGSVEDAFRQVHGRSRAETQRLWQERLKQQYGS